MSETIITSKLDAYLYISIDDKDRVVGYSFVSMTISIYLSSNSDDS